MPRADKEKKTQSLLAKSSVSIAAIMCKGNYCWLTSYDTPGSILSASRTLFQLIFGITWEAEALHISRWHTRKVSDMVGKQ